MQDSSFKPLFSCDLESYKQVVPSSYDCGCINDLAHFCYLIRRKLNVHCAKIIVQIFHTLGAWDDKIVSPLSKHPGKHKLGFSQHPSWPRVHGPCWPIQCSWEKFSGKKRGNSRRVSPGSKSSGDLRAPVRNPRPSGELNRKKEISINPSYFQSNDRITYKHTITTSSSRTASSKPFCSISSVQGEYSIWTVAMWYTLHARRRVFALHSERPM